jgi:cytochrome bd-type quinol oxidase subunit 2
MSAIDQVQSVGRSVGLGARQLLTDLRNRIDVVGASVTLGNDASGSTVRTLQRNDFIVRLLSTLTGLVVTFGVSYYGIRWLVNAMDPTKHEKKEAQKRVSILLVIGYY